MVQTITFRPTKAARNYLKGIENKSKEINDALEIVAGKMKMPVMDRSIAPPPQSIYGQGICERVAELKKTKALEWIMDKKSSDEVFGDKPATQSDLQGMLSEIQSKTANSDDFYDDEIPAAPVKDKKYYKDLETYKEIKKKHGCVDKYGEWLDTSDALKYAGLEDFTPLD